CYSCVGFFGLLRGGEFTVNSPFDASLHLTHADIQVDAPLNPQSVRVFINFLGNYLHLRGPGPGPLFLYQDGTPLSRSELSAFLKTTLYPLSTVSRCSWKFLRS
ncbi:unnamed protein product, partial [Porites evermanni]